MKLKKLIFATFTSVLLSTAVVHADEAAVTAGSNTNTESASSKYHFNYNHTSFNSLEGGTWGKGKGWTYTKPDGTEAIGWTMIDGDLHYFDENGWMYMNCTTPDGYFVDENGVLSATGENTEDTLSNNLFTGEWIKSPKGWKYKKEDGTYLTSWHWIDGNKDGIAECYYFDSEGELVTNSRIDGYKLNQDGAMLTSKGTVNALKVTSDWNDDAISGQFEFRYYDKGSNRYYEPNENEKWAYLKLKDESTITVTFNKETLDYIRIKDTVYKNMESGNEVSVAYDGDIYLSVGNKEYFYYKL